MVLASQNGHSNGHIMHTRRKIAAVLMRAGTSKGLFLKATDLPQNKQDWNDILLSAMGSPDPFGRQLDGCGGGSSTTSKIAVVGPSPLKGVDVDYTFVAVPIGGGSLDFSGNCGNMASGVGPFAVEERLIPCRRNGPMTVTFRNTNTGVILKSTFNTQNGIPLEDGDCVVDGVSQSGAPIELAFLNPAGSMTGQLLPSGKAVNMLQLPNNPSGLKQVEASLVDAANPFVFVRAQDLGLQGNEIPSALVSRTEVLMAVRCAAAVAMGLAKTPEAADLVPGTPKICLCGPPADYTTSSGRQFRPEDMDISVRPFSMGAPHPSLQMTGAVCLAAACAVPGAIPNQIITAARSSSQYSGPLRFAHGSGVIETEANLSVDSSGHVEMRSASVYRTARRLFEGNVSYMVECPPSETEGSSFDNAATFHNKQPAHLEYARPVIAV